MIIKDGRRRGAGFFLDFLVVGVFEVRLCRWHPPSTRGLKEALFPNHFFTRLSKGNRWLIRESYLLY